jgi:hypothetical protein
MNQPDKISVNVIEMTNIFHVKEALPSSVCQEISKQVLNYKSRTPTSENTHPNCWRGTPHLSDSGISADINEILQDTISRYRSIYEETLIKPSLFGSPTGEIKRYDTENPKINAWFNVNGTNGGNMVHSHSGNYLSGTLYFQAEGTGYIEFLSQSYLFKNMHHCWPYFGSARYHPRDGDLLMFPSYLAHFVEPNPSLRARINMAFDIRYDFKIA